MKRLITSCLVMVLLFSWGTGIASAHVTVQPEETTQGSYETFTVQVPTESDEVPTIKVKIEIPSSVFISRFEPKSGWRYEIERDGLEKITSVTWVAENEGFLPTEFGLFNMQGRVADDATEIVWKAYQTYQDGSVVEWVGAEDSQLPASVTKVNAKSAADSVNHHNNENISESKENVKADIGGTTETSSSSNTPFYLSITALIFALLSLGVSLYKRT